MNRNPRDTAGDPPWRKGLDRAEDLARQLNGALAAAGHTVAVAESLTAGRLGAVLAEAPGASRTFRGGVIAYATEVKAMVLGVDQRLLTEEGAVHGEVAGQMAEGVRRLMDASYGVATTGVAGPDTQDGRRIGTLFVAVCGPQGTVVEAPHTGSGRGRKAIQERAVVTALELLRDHLRPPRQDGR
ncbi:CinA family protein [Streptomyces formicae]|uniref:CinA family protein n=1 Tax=Streptomyces formicae TaxID=1616117 RepID=A0ABY3WSA8_9ACTN|nr:CinA family protein [Streptomyces formicae]UNM13460.1 CinA family protein [Streptomyces formicae]